MSGRSALAAGGSEDPSSTLGRWNAMIRRARLTDWQKLVCLAVSSYAGPDGCGIRPGIAGLAVDLKRDPSTIESYLRWMRQVGLIEIERRGNRRAREADVYRLVLSSTLNDAVQVLTPEEYHEAKEIVRAQIRAANLEKHRRYVAKHCGEPGKHRGKRATKDAENQPLATPVQPSVSPQVENVHQPLPEDQVETTHQPLKNELSTLGRNAVTSGDATPPSISTFQGLAKQGQTSTLTDDAERAPEPLRTILTSLCETDPDVTLDEARAVHRLIAERHNVRSTRYYAKIATDRGFSGYLAEIRGKAQEERAVALAAQLAELEKGPECVHGMPGGASPHPTHGEPLCPKCRRGVPGPEPIEPATAADEIASAWGKARNAAGWRQMNVPLLVKVRSQIDFYLRGGVPPEELRPIAVEAATQGLDVLTYIQNATGRAGQHA